MFLRNLRIRLAALMIAVPGAILLRAQPVPQAAPTVGSAYKNIQVLTDLKDAPTTQFIGAMQFMSGSLGVSCNYCHVSQQGPFESDANARKLKAREMIKMVRALNANAFDGRQAVTCYTCHRGSSRSIGTPVPWDKTPEEIAAYKASVPAQAASAPARAPASGSTADELFDRYRRVVGARTLKSLRLIGVNTVAMSASAVPFEADALFPDKFLIQANNPAGEVRTIVNGAQAWRRSGSSVTPLPAPQLASLRVTADVVIDPVKFERSTQPRNAIGAEQIGARTYDVLEAQLPDGPQRLYFDRETGLLYKVRTEVRTPLGTRVEERTFEDYRTVDGITLPFLIRNHYMEDQSEFRISRAEVNVAFDAARFEPGGGP
jgi:hypothetical protein